MAPSIGRLSPALRAAPPGRRLIEGRFAAAERPRRPGVAGAYEAAARLGAGLGRRLDIIA